MTVKKLTEQNSAPAQYNATGVPAPTPFTWQNLAGHWLRSPAVNAYESEAAARRQAAVQRWRGQTPEAACRA